MKNWYRHIIFTLVVLSTPIAGCAQVQVEQQIDSIQIMIGQQTDLHVRVTLPKGKRVDFPSLKPSQYITPGVEVLKMKDDTTEVDDKSTRITRSYTLTSFDEKIYAIPALKVKVAGKSYQGNQLALKVLTVPVDTIHPNQFYPPKDVQDNPFSWAEWAPLFWLSILFLLLCGVGFYLYDRLRKNKPVITHIKIVKKVPAHQKALHEINEMKQHRVETQEGQKEYYTRLTDTLREYIQQRFGFNAMEMTSSEIIEHLQATGDKTMIRELHELFQTADLVKFAKYETLINENDANLVNAINFIDQTKTDEIPTEEKVKPQLSDDDVKTRKNRIVLKSLIAGLIIASLAILGYVIYNVVMLLM